MTKMNAHKNLTPSICSSVAVIQNSRITAAGKNYGTKPYNLSVSSYVEVKDNREVVDIAKRNALIKTTVETIDKLRIDIDAIIEEIEA